MQNFTVISLLEIGAILVMIIGVCLVFRNRETAGKERGHALGLGVSTLQHLALFLIIPSVFVLALEKAIDAQAVTAILGGIIGYVLASVDKKEGNAKKPNTPKEELSTTK